MSRVKSKIRPRMALDMQSLVQKGGKILRRIVFTYQEIRESPLVETLKVSLQLIMLEKKIDITLFTPHFSDLNCL